MNSSKVLHFSACFQLAILLTPNDLAIFRVRVICTHCRWTPACLGFLLFLIVGIRSVNLPLFFSVYLVSSGGGLEQRESSPYGARTEWDQSLFPLSSSVHEEEEEEERRRINKPIIRAWLPMNAACHNGIVANNDRQRI